MEWDELKLSSNRSASCELSKRLPLNVAQSVPADTVFTQSISQSKSLKAITGNRSTASGLAGADNNRQKVQGHWNLGTQRWQETGDGAGRARTGREGYRPGEGRQADEGFPDLGVSGSVQGPGELEEPG
jgi:hypothetical protein